MPQRIENRAETDWHRAYIGLGSNLGDREGNIRQAINLMKGDPKIRFVRATELLSTAPWGPVHQPVFLNAVVEIETCWGPLALLRQLKKWERILGREPGGVRWGPRIIDLDILLYGDVVMESDELTIPHARLTERSFVLRQLLELNSELVHPETGDFLKKFNR